MNKEKPTKVSHEVDGYIPGLRLLGPEALANLTAALAEQDPGAYNSAQTLEKIVEEMEAKKYR